MFKRFASAAILCVALVAPGLAAAADRGPSTPEERKQALAYIESFETNPLGPDAANQREWVLKWIIEVPDIHISICSIFDKLPGPKEVSGNVLAGMMMSQVAFAIQNPDAKPDGQEAHLAGANGALRVYEALVKAKPKDRQPYFDDLVKRRDAGTLAQLVQEHSAACSQKSN
jgi:hypothetical protein